MPSLLVYGDSNSYGTPPMAERGLAARLPKEQRWPNVMAAALGAQWEVIVEGLPGRTTVHDDPVEGAYRNGMTVLPAVLHSHGPLDMVIIFLGTNDLKMRFNVPAIDIALSVGRLAETVRASGVARDVIMVCPPVVRELGCLAGVFEGAEARGAGMFVDMMQEAARLGFGFVDAGAHIAVDPLDGVHFNVEAHARLGAEMADAVRERVRRQGGKGAV
ncbi:SGNH/GDSL hydrolase family protein [Oceaniglobus ichthyenteri]|uniref:SGNH/GDSL hydrolase family protein n=1 Tax=Oceaniglobus ichthyenteri TaxID=2136177 RepID=UPI000D361BFC|nr:SGNH/GDSL hydrolase family protein [Oceaniglobus ichthyenteri]